MAAQGQGESSGKHEDHCSMSSADHPKSMRWRAASLHLGACLLIAALAALLVFLCWYPWPFAAITDVAPVFLMLVGIDIAVGPALTLVVAKPTKHRAELVRDLSVIAILQLGALAYGLHSVASARPVALVFEADLLRLVTASDIEPESLAEAPQSLRELSWRGPTLMSATKPTDADELLRTIELGLAGVPLAALPKYWRDYATQADQVWQTARPVPALLTRYPNLKADAAAIARDAGQPPEALRFVPLVSRQASWVALIAAPNARVVGYLPVDGFF
jgi:hypothetical protein